MLLVQLHPSVRFMLHQYLVSGVLKLVLVCVMLVPVVMVLFVANVVHVPVLLLLHVAVSVSVVSWSLVIT